MYHQLHYHHINCHPNQFYCGDRSPSKHSYRSLLSCQSLLCWQRSSFLHLHGIVLSHGQLLLSCRTSILFIRSFESPNISFPNVSFPFSWFFSLVFLLPSALNWFISCQKSAGGYLTQGNNVCISNPPCRTKCVSSAEYLG